jgi:transposase
VIIGVDPHPGSHTAVAMSDQDGVFDTVSVSSGEGGHRELREWARRFPRREWAIEGSGNPYIRGFAQDLVSSGEIVYNIPPAFTSLYRSRQRQGKDDEIDAARVAYALRANRKKLHPLDTSQMQHALKELTRSYLKLKGQLTANRMALREAESSQVRAAYTEVIESLQIALAELKRALAKHIRCVARGLLEPVGYGPITAAVILAEVGSIARFPSRDNLASYAGSASIPWSSGSQTSVRVNPGGNRRLNWAIHMIVRTRLRIDPKTQAYRDRKLSEGKTTREVYRLIKTYVAREIYRLMKEQVPMM